VNKNVAEKSFRQRRMKLLMEAKTAWVVELRMTTQFESYRLFPSSLYLLGRLSAGLSIFIFQQYGRPTAKPVKEFNKSMYTALMCSLSYITSEAQW
jgi:hypothetical protein